jgi:phosphate transport system substrate-binding protein
MKKKMWLQQWNRLAGASLGLALVFLLSGCGGGGGKLPDTNDTTTKGVLRVSIDESFKPVLDSQIKVFMASFPDAKIVAEYKPEAECLKDLENDSTKMVIVTRGLSREEADRFKEKLGFGPSWGVLAYDAVAIITNKKSKDSTFTLSELRSMLEGSSADKKKIVMDGLSATSTVRFAIDTILKGKALGPNVVAAKSSPEVIDYVSSDPNAIGMIGVSWIGNGDDPEQLSFLSKVNVAAMMCETCEEEGVYVKPYQANIAMGRYPLPRTLNYIMKENYQGIGRGFVNFMIHERGQLIFKRAYLLPGRMQFDVRNMNINQ